MKKFIISSILLFIAGIALTITGVCVSIPEISNISNTIESNRKTGTEEFDTSSLGFIVNAGKIRLHSSSNDISYVDYSINGITKISYTDNLFKTEFTTDNWLYQSISYSKPNEFDIFIAQTLSSTMDLSIELNAGELEIDENLSLKSINIKVNASNVEIKKLTAEAAKFEVNAGNFECALDAKDIQFIVNAGNCELKVLHPEDYYSIGISANLGTISLSPKNKTSQSGSEAGYSITGSVNAGNCEIKFNS